jgi:diacylglycerol kinase family enzyme
MNPDVDLLVVVGLLPSLAAARAAFAVHVDLPSTSAPRHPVLFCNPKSGGGKAMRFALAQEAGQRGIEAVELQPGDDLEALVRAAVARGADGLAMAGGDGSQAIVAAIAAELGLPYACIPAGTRNHFALDLGIDRDDVVGALDAFVDGGKRRVDLGDVNGRVFVDNVSRTSGARGRAHVVTKTDAAQPSTLVVGAELPGMAARSHQSSATTF